MKIYKTQAIVYCRVSSTRQVREGHGLNSQEQRCRNYAHEKNYEVINVFRDEGVSGGLFDRPAMKAMIKYLDEHMSQSFVIIFDDLSRFARDVKVHLRLKTELGSRGAELECLNYSFDDSPEGEFIETILAGKAQLDRQQNRRQVFQKMKARMDQGYWCLCQPTGMFYKQTIEHGKLLHLDNPVAEIIKEACVGFSNDRFLTQSDVQRFLQSHADTLGKGKVHLQFVKRILTQILYTGYIEYKKWDVKKRKGHHESLFDISVYEKNQHKLHNTVRSCRKTDKADFPLRRYIDCAACGKTMTASRVKGKLKYYKMYTCNNSVCTASPKNIQKKILEDKFIGLLKSISPDKNTLTLVEAITTDILKDQKNNSSKLRSLHIKEMKAHEQKIDSYLELIPKANETLKDRYEKKIEKIEGEIKLLKENTYIDSTLDETRVIKLVFDFIGTPSKYWLNTDLEGKQMLHKMIFLKNPCYDATNGFGTPELSLPFTIKQHLVEMTGVEPVSSSGE